MSEEPRTGRAAPTPWLLYVALSGLVWGLFVPDQGLWHDDVQNLFRAYVAPERGEGLFPAITTPTRRLLGLPFLLALASGWPVQCLHLLSAAGWLGSGLLAARLAARLWPHAHGAAAIAGALTLCATPDFFTDAPVAVAYLISIDAYLGAALLGLAWLQDGRRSALWAAAPCLAAALWTSDAAAAAWLLTPLLWAAAPAARGRRMRWLLLVWYLVPAPYVFLMASQLLAGGGYLQGALVPLAPAAWLRRLGSLLLWNVTPWRWAFDRPLWFPRVESVVPVAVRMALALAGGAAAALVLFRPSRAEHAEGAERGGIAPAVAALALMAATNLSFVSVHLAELYCRTHLLSRVFASLALAWLAQAAWSRARGPLGRVLVRLAVGVWLCLGIAGALERQDYFVGYARAHRRELTSLLAAVPALAPDAHLLLRVPPHRRYLATEAGYLARAWMVLLHQDSSVECRVFLWSANRSTTCTALADGFECRGERSPDCRRLDGKDTQRLPYDRLVVLDYEPAGNRYVLAPALAEAGGGRYRPHEQMPARPPARAAHRLLSTHRGLAAWLWP